MQCSALFATGFYVFVGAVAVLGGLGLEIPAATGAEANGTTSGAETRVSPKFSALNSEALRP